LKQRILKRLRQIFSNIYLLIPILAVAYLLRVAVSDLFVVACFESAVLLIVVMIVAGLTLYCLLRRELSWTLFYGVLLGGLVVLLLLTVLSPRPTATLSWLTVLLLFTTPYCLVKQLLRTEDLIVAALFLILWVFAGLATHVLLDMRAVMVAEFGSCEAIVEGVRRAARLHAFNFLLYWASLLLTPLHRERRSRKRTVLAALLLLNMLLPCDAVIVLQIYGGCLTQIVLIITIAASVTAQIALLPLLNQELRLLQVSQDRSRSIAATT